MSVRVIEGDCRDVLRTLPDQSVQMVCTSPPYFALRSYLPSDHPDKARELGSESTVEAYVANLVAVFREVRRVLASDGTLWLNLGDSYAMTTRGAGGRGKQHTNNGSVLADRRAELPGGLKPKDLIGIPWRVAFALQADGWYLRSDIIWAKPNPMPESVRDRCTKSHEYIFMLTKQPRYFFDAEAVKESNSSPEQLAHNLKYAKPYAAYDDRAGDSGQPGNVNNVGIHARPGTAGRNIRSVWTIPTHPLPMAHFATFPPALVEPCIKAGTSEKGACPSCGAPWVRVVESERVPLQTTYNGAVKSEPMTPGGVRWGGSGVPSRLATTTLGWQPSCTCDGTFVDEPYTPDEPERTWKRFVPGPDGVRDPVPCVVLDPFGGAGTVGLVADRLGRDAVLIELNPEYTDMAKRRITADAPLFAEVS